MRTAASPATGDALHGEHEADLRLVGLARQGDLRAFDELVTRHRARIFAMIRNMIRHESDAWDLCQEVFIKAWWALDGFETRARFSTWLYRIAHNVVCDWSRKRRLEHAGEFDDEILSHESIDPASSTTPTAGQAPDVALANRELRDRIEDALARLSPEHRQAVLLKDVQGLSYRDIAEVMNCTLGTVMSRLHYARQKLQTLLQDLDETR